MKLITPPGMLLTTALLVIYGAYAFSIGSIENSWSLKAAGTAAVIACYGAAMVRPWSRFLVYLLTVGFIGKLGASIVTAVRTGFFEFQFGAHAEIVRSLAPSAAMVMIALICCAIVARQFAGTGSARKFTTVTRNVVQTASTKNSSDSAASADPE